MEWSDDEARLDRRRLLAIGGAAAAAVALRGTAPAAAAPRLSGTLRIYNWAQYQDPTNLHDFTRQTGVHVAPTFYTSNEELLTKLQTTKGQPTYDIIVPDGDHVRIEKGLGLLAKLDHSKIPNLKYLGPQWRTLPYDKGNVYSVPKDAGVTGFTLRTDHVKATLESWKDFFDFLPKAHGLRVNFIESPAEVVGVALNALGHSMNTQDAGQLAAAKQLLLKVRPYVTTINEVYLDEFIGGKIDLGITYSGDGIRIRTARAKQKDIRVVLPSGRSEIWLDNWAISAYSPNPDAAHAWINFILDPKRNAREMKYVQYEVATPASYKYVGAAAHDPAVVFPKRIFQQYEVLRTTPQGLQQREAIWTAFKAA